MARRWVDGCRARDRRTRRRVPQLLSRAAVGAIRSVLPQSVFTKICMGAARFCRGAAAAERGVGADAAGSPPPAGLSQPSYNPGKYFSARKNADSLTAVSFQGCSGRALQHRSRGTPGALRLRARWRRGGALPLRYLRAPPGRLKPHSCRNNTNRIRIPLRTE